MVTLSRMDVQTKRDALHARRGAAGRQLLCLQEDTVDPLGFVFFNLLSVMV